jgi:hypothetical protein
VSNETTHTTQPAPTDKTSHSSLSQAHGPNVAKVKPQPQNSEQQQVCYQHKILFNAKVFSLKRLRLLLLIHMRRLPSMMIMWEHSWHHIQPTMPPFHNLQSLQTCFHKVNNRKNLLDTRATRGRCCGGSPALIYF